MHLAHFCFERFRSGHMQDGVGKKRTSALLPLPERGCRANLHMHLSPFFFLLPCSLSFVAVAFLVLLFGL